MSARDELIWKMAEAAWSAHYCPAGAKGDLCADCKENGQCFELGNGFGKRDNQWEWYHTARGALEALEAEKSVQFDMT